MPDDEQHSGFVIKENDSAAFCCMDWAVERYLDATPSHIKSIFRKILDNIKARMQNGV
jgi:hypothetical protein